jgi:secreted trypsin-like serine protease
MVKTTHAHAHARTRTQEEETPRWSAAAGFDPRRKKIQPKNAEKMPARPLSGRTMPALAALLVVVLLSCSARVQGQGEAADEQQAPGSAEAPAEAVAVAAAAAAEAVAVAAEPPPPELRVTAGSPAAEGRYSYICSLRSSSSPYSDSFCGCAVVAPRIVLTAAHCLDQDDPSLRLPRVEIGRYRRVDAVRPGLDPPLTEADDGIERLRCERSVVHPGWSFATTRNDVALCYLNEPTDWQPVGLADVPAPQPGTPLVVIGWGTERAGAPEQAQTLQRAEMPLVDLEACNATFNGALRQGQLCAGSAAAFGQLVADACQGDSGGPLVLEGGGGENGGNGGDTQVGIVSFGESCGILPGVYTDVAAYRRWIGETALAMAAEAGLAPEDVAQILPAAMAPDAEERAVVAAADGEAPPPPLPLPTAAKAEAAARAVLTAAQEARQQQPAAASLTATSVSAISGASSAADLAGALVSMILLPGGQDPCACVTASSLAGAGGCRPMLGPASSEWGCFVSGGQACALATQAGGGLFARGCRPTPSELWSARAAAAGPTSGARDAAAALRAVAAASAEGEDKAAAACAAGEMAAPTATGGVRLRLGGGRVRSAAAAAAAKTTGLLVDPSKVRAAAASAGATTTTRAAKLPRVLAAAFRVGYAEAMAAAAAGGGGGGGARR